jgi:hypothetical protein
MPAWLIAVLAIVAVVWTAAGIAAMAAGSQKRVEGRTGLSYRVQSGPTGIPWLSAFVWDTGWITLPFHWANYLLRRPRTWSVTLTEAKSWWMKPRLLSEEYPTRQEAEFRLTEIVMEIKLGRPTPAFGTEKRSLPEGT